MDTIGARAGPDSTSRLAGLARPVFGSAKESNLFAVRNRIAEPAVIVGDLHVIYPREFESVRTGCMVTRTTRRRFMALLTTHEILGSSIVWHKQMKHVVVQDRCTVNDDTTFDLEP